MKYLTFMMAALAILSAVSIILIVLKGDFSAYRIGILFGNGVLLIFAFGVIGYTVGRTETREIHE